MPSSGPKWSISPEQNFFWYKPLLLLSSTYLLVLCIVQNFKKFLQWIQSYDDAPFLGPKWSICSKQIIFQKNNILIYLLAPFKFLRNSSSGSRVMRMRKFWAQNGPFSQMIIFFRKPVNDPCFFRSCLSTCQKSKSDINLLVKC